MEWANGLKEGDLVDALKEETNVKKQNKLCWSRAKVTNVLQTFIEIEFLNESQIFTKTLRKDTLDIAPLKSKTADDWDWRFQLKAGDLIDCCDAKCIWYVSTVLDVSVSEINGTQIHQARVGYR